MPSDQVLKFTIEAVYLGKRISLQAQYQILTAKQIYLIAQGKV